jgi:hypothetical protein
MERESTHMWMARNISENGEITSDKESESQLILMARKNSEFGKETSLLLEE